MEPTTQPSLEALITLHRNDLESIGNQIIVTKKQLDSVFPVIENEDRGEVIANLMLAYRHIEDAKMRLGKVFQARDGGVSNNIR